MDFNQQIIDAFRANAGEVRAPIDFGRSVALLHVPLKDGGTRVVPLRTVEQDGAQHVVASAAGSPKHPAWVYGLRRSEGATIDVELPGDGEIGTVALRVTELTGADRDALWAAFLEAAPAFAEYERTAEGRVFPIFRLAEAG